MAKKNAPKRKVAKRYPRVQFTHELFDGEFDLPKMDSMPLGVVTGIGSGDLGKLIDFLHEYATDEVEAIESLGSDEMESFFEAWGNASGVEAPK